MKNIINFKSILAFPICLAGTLTLATSCSEDKTVDSKEIAKQENIEKLAADDQMIVVVKNDNGTKFLMAAAEVQLEEISLGKLAQQKGMASDVKELGKMMEADHSKSLLELTDLAKSKSISIPTSLTEDSKNVYAKLEEETGREFDKTYSAMMVKHHEDALKLYEKAAVDSEDAAIKSWAASKLPGLKTHLDHAKTCEKKSNADS